MTVNKILMADDTIGSYSHIKKYPTNTWTKTLKKIISSIKFGENLTPQPYVDSQKISHYFYWNWIEHQNHNWTIVKRIILVSLDSQIKS